MQDTLDPLGAHVGQAIRGLTQPSLEPAERPGRPAVTCPRWHAPRFGQDPFGLGHPLAERASSCVSWFQRIESCPIEPAQQLSHGIATAVACGLGSLGVAGTVGYGQYGFCPRYVGCWLTLRTAQLLEETAFLLSERAKRIFLTARHGWTS